MAIEVMNRCEKKYRLDQGTFDALQERLSQCMIPDPYSKNGETYPILNLYYDTPTNDLIRTSLMKPVYKEKLRLRSYGTPEAGSKVYVEIKKKVRGVVNKRRSAMTLAEAYEFLENGSIPALQPHMNGQVLREIAYMYEHKALKAKLSLSYERFAYFGEGDLRVSFDTNIRVRRCDLRLESGGYGEPLLDDGMWLMEIKTSRAFPLWLCEWLTKYNIRPSSFSKYGTEYKQTLARTMPAVSPARGPAAAAYAQDSFAGKGEKLYA